jgi:hypothetical protein
MESVIDLLHETTSIVIEQDSITILACTRPDIILILALISKTVVDIATCCHRGNFP